MKRQDMMMVAAVILFSAVFSTLVSSVFFKSSSKKKLSAEVVEPISPEFQTPDPRVFNDTALNPTQLIQIGDSTNPRPF